MESENKDNWPWFLVQMQDEIFDVNREIFIVFDRSKELMEAIFLVFPNACHSYCFLHLTQDLYYETKDNLVRSTNGRL